MSEKVNTIHIHEQDNLFKAIVCIGIDFLEDKNNFAAVDKKTVNFIERRRRRADSMVSFVKKDADITKNILLVLPEGQGESPRRVCARPLLHLGQPRLLRSWGETAEGIW